MDKIVSLCKRRGFVFQSSEIYGGFAHLRLRALRRVAQITSSPWWRSILQERDDVVGIDLAIITIPRS